MNTIPLVTVYHPGNTFTTRPIRGVNVHIGEYRPFAVPILYPKELACYMSDGIIYIAKPTPEWSFDALSWEFDISGTILFAEACLFEQRVDNTGQIMQLIVPVSTFCAQWIDSSDYVHMKSDYFVEFT